MCDMTLSDVRHDSFTCVERGSDVREGLYV